MENSHGILTSSQNIPKISNLPNLRLLCNYTQRPGESSSFQRAAIYRSSKPDRINGEELLVFRSLGIKCIIDFRSKEEYYSTDGQRLLDKEYILHKVIPAKKVGQALTTEQIDVDKTGKVISAPTASTSSNNTESDSTILAQDGLEKKHFLINFFTPRYILTCVSKLPFYLYCVGIFHLLWDLIRRDTSFKGFGRFFTKTALNMIGIKAQYVDISDLCQPAICAALKLIADPHNQPVLVNCAHGKDRTGIVSALVLTCLGLPKEDIIEEYTLSEEGLAPITHLVRRDLCEKYQLNEEFLTAKASTMRNFLDHLEDKYGSVENYMEAIGFSREEQLSLRSRLSLADSLATRSDGDVTIIDPPSQASEENSPRSRVKN